MKVQSRRKGVSLALRELEGGAKYPDTKVIMYKL